MFILCAGRLAGFQTNRRPGPWLWCWRRRKQPRRLSRTCTNMSSTGRKSVECPLKRLSLVISERWRFDGYWKILVDVLWGWDDLIRSLLPVDWFIRVWLSLRELGRLRGWLKVHQGDGKLWQKANARNPIHLVFSRRPIGMTNVYLTV